MQRPSRAIANNRTPIKYRHVQHETGSVQGKGRGGACLSVFRYSVSPFRSPDERSDIRGRLRGFTAAPPGLASLTRATNKNEGSGTPANAGYHRRILRCGARPFGARTPDGVPPRLSPQGIIPSQRLSFRPGFLGRGLNGRYPPSPVPVQGSTSHPGRNAGRHDAQAAREQAAKPPAGAALAPMARCASAPCPSLSEDANVTGIETYVKGTSRKE
jgi:hypothetical protein